MSEWLSETAGRQIRLLRKRRGWKLKDLAAASNYSLTYLSDMERGRQNVSIKSLEIIAAALGAIVSIEIRECNE
jgi:transcriptional regulator with XRE-family HTH domain